MSKTPDVASGLAKAKRVVIKIGSSLLFDRKSLGINAAWLTALAADIARLKSRGLDVILVSSGAIALGRHKLKLDTRALRLEESQAAAAVGQIDLAHAWCSVLEPHGLTVAQVLVTLNDTESRRRYLNARSTMETLLKFATIPVINENDTVATSEIRYGDNDRLAARMAGMISADWLILLSDIDGLYTEDPRKGGAAQLIPRVNAITPEITKLAGAAPPKDATQLGSGGMVTKLEAARIATSAGCHTVIADGRVLAPLSAIEAGASCTWFVASASPAQARKNWIAGSLAPKGAIAIDAGAERALRQGRSLLPAGVKSVSGIFERGDAVAVTTLEGVEIARGLIAYDHDHARAIMGKRSAEIAATLGFEGREEMIHRDDLSLRDAAGASEKWD
ncbi:MAG TPA: glutamate 5-kinase [Alphaproteobacteria bacterium]|nr:glutamate 5-kinase [Alphaproteobacteria bacterium]